MILPRRATSGADHRRKSCKLACSLLVLLGACGDSTTTHPDAAVAEDASPPGDGGVRALCPALAAPECTSAAECSTAISPPTGCVACPRSYAALCAFGACNAPPLLMVTDRQDLIQNVGPYRGMIGLLRAAAVAAETAGGATIGCPQIYDRSITLDDPCLNVLDSRRLLPDPLRPDDVYTIPLSRFASGQRTLFVAHVHTSTDGRDNPLAFSCTEAQVGAPGEGPAQIAGEDLVPY
jgi:hypothetical protein